MNNGEEVPQANRILQTNYFLFVFNTVHITWMICLSAAESNMLRFLLGSISLSVSSQESTSCSQPLRSLSELARFTTWAQRQSNPLLLSMSRCSLLTRLLLWLYLLLAGRQGSHKAELIRSGRTKNKWVKWWDARQGRKAGGSVETLVLWCHQDNIWKIICREGKEAEKVNAKWRGVTSKTVSAQGIFTYFILLPINTSF